MHLMDYMSEQSTVIGKPSPYQSTMTLVARTSDTTAGGSGAFDETFCRTLPGQPRIWDPSRFGPKMTCDRKHFLQTILGLRRNGFGSIHLEWGSIKHDCDELFDNLLLAGHPREWCTEAAIDFAFRSTWNLETNRPRWTTPKTLAWCHSPSTREHKKRPGVIVQNREQCRNAKHGTELEVAEASWLMQNSRGEYKCGDCGERVSFEEKVVNDHPKKNRHSMLRAVCLYCDTIGELQPFVFPDGTPGTEIQFRVPLPIYSPDPCPALHLPVHDPDSYGHCHICQGTGYLPYELLVNLDSLVRWAAQTGEEILIRERKTTGRNKLNERFWMQFEMNPQIDSYDLAGSILFAAGRAQAIGVLVEVTRVGNKDVEIQRLPIYISAERRAEWLDEICGYIKDSERLARALQQEPEAAEQIYKRQIGACLGNFGRCAMWELCTSPRSERQAIIEADYHVERWDPIKARTVLETEQEED